MKRYNYPKTVPVGGFVYTVEMADAAYTTDSAPHMADTFADIESIRIATRTPAGGYRSIAMLEECFLHEVMHAVNETWNTALTEEQVEGMAQGMLQVMHSLGVKIITEA